MFDRIGVIDMAQNLARHASARQNLLAENVANADTPGFKGRDLAPFAAAYAEGAPMRATRPGHIGGAGEPAFTPVLAGGEASPDGNTVSLEGEMVRSASVKKEHDLALAVYRSSLSILRTALGRR